MGKIADCSVHICEHNLFALKLFREIDANETSCWMNRVGLFINDQLSPAVKSCIESYAKATGFVDEEEEDEEEIEKGEDSDGKSVCYCKRL